MRLVRFEDDKGKDIYINPDYIRYITDEYIEKDNEYISCISMIGSFVYVKGKAEDVGNRLDY